VPFGVVAEGTILAEEIIQIGGIATFRVASLEMALFSRRAVQEFFGTVDAAPLAEFVAIFLMFFHVPKRPPRSVLAPGTMKQTSHAHPFQCQSRKIPKRR
jgi:hypothetical protein